MVYDVVCVMVCASVCVRFCVYKRARLFQRSVYTFDGVRDGNDGRLDHLLVLGHSAFQLSSAQAVARYLEK